MNLVLCKYLVRAEQSRAKQENPLPENLWQVITLPSEVSVLLALVAPTGQLGLRADNWTLHNLGRASMNLSTKSVRPWPVSYLSHLLMILKLLSVLLRLK